MPGIHDSWDTVETKCYPNKVCFNSVDAVPKTSIVEIDLSEFKKFTFTFDGEKIDVSGKEIWEALNS